MRRLLPRFCASKYFYSKFRSWNQSLNHGVNPRDFHLLLRWAQLTGKFNRRISQNLQWSFSITRFLIFSFTQLLVQWLTVSCLPLMPFAAYVGACLILGNWVCFAGSKFAFISVHINGDSSAFCLSASSAKDSDTSKVAKHWTAFSWTTNRFTVAVMSP